MNKENLAKWLFSRDMEYVGVVRGIFNFVMYSIFSLLFFGGYILGVSWIGLTIGAWLG